VGSSIPRGFEIWVQKGVRKGKINLAGQLVEAWKKYNILPLRPTPIRSTANHHFRGLYNDNLTHNAPLIEVGFISNPSDVNLIVRNYKRTAEAIAHGLMNYIRTL
jgi:N-acetylmuramoyl-L-alanine amidase